jgi:hypothetical protein
VNLDEVGSNVVGTGSGTLDLSGLTLSSSNATTRANVTASDGIIELGPAVVDTGDVYSGFSGPTSFGGGGTVNATSGTGPVGILGAFNDIVVPHGYVSNAALSDTATWANQDFSSLGVTPGTYLWTWGTGVHADSFTLQIGPAAVPEPASMVLFGTALAGLGVIRRRRRAS